ncbi:MAG TPA: PEP-CTERM sorting domain-containing protein [Burkholderiaceae bacterium]
MRTTNHFLTRHALPALLASCLMGALLPAHAQTVLLSDNFNTEHGGVGSAEYSGFANFSAANVDLLAPGYFYNLCEAAGGSSTCIDMEGSGNGALTTLEAYTLAPGEVTMQFDLAGDQRGRSGNSVTASLVGVLGNVLFSETFALASDAAFTTFSRTISLGTETQARLHFLSNGPADSMGMLLDNVVLTAGGGGVIAPVPEPSTWALFVGGLLAVGAVVRRRGPAA